METKLNHLEIFKDFCKKNQSVIDWFKNIVNRKNSQYIVDSFVDSSIIHSKWNRNRCTILLSYDRLGSLNITISKKGVELTSSNLPEYFDDIAIEILELYSTVLSLMRDKILINSYKDSIPLEE